MVAELAQSSSAEAARCSGFWFLRRNIGILFWVQSRHSAEHGGNPQMERLRLHWWILWQ
jgi:hypothetical protein